MMIIINYGIFNLVNILAWPVRVENVIYLIKTVQVLPAG